MKMSVFFAVTFLFLGVAASALCADSSTPVATGEAYFDIVTGHKYIRNDDGSYAEYNKKGALFRSNIPNTQPHLARSDYIVEIMPDSYIVYERFTHNRPVQKFLPTSSEHPKGWMSKKLLVSATESPRTLDVGLGYTKEIPLKSFSPIVTGKAYFDLSTGHRYIRNDDGSYAEYTKKGELFRSSVSSSQPHLARNKYVVEIMQDAYIVYEKTINNKAEQRILPASSKHLEGWKSKRLLMSAKKSHRPMDVGLGHTKE